MLDERQRRAELLFKELMTFPVSVREREIAARCRGDDALAREVRGLLAFAADETGPLEDLVPAHVGSAEAEQAGILPPGCTIGRYTLLRVLGEGGMGIVYVAEQERPKRTVAIKVIRPECATRSMLRRFEFEAEILGRLQHAGIAQVIEAGITEPVAGRPGTPFLAMELIEGSHIAAFVREQKLSIRDRVAMFLGVCDAVEHAHQRGVIHRDLKPANIVVDRSGQPKVLDFGVARAVAPDSLEPGLTIDRTGHRQLIGTLAYMSPEQVVGSPSDLDTRSDVYSLGVVLFELVTGALPHDLSDRSVPEAVRIINDAVPTTPSTLVPECRGDLDTIILKALEKDRSRRYQSASDLAADLRRYLSHAPIAARPPSAMYNIRKFAARNKKFVVSLVALAAALVIGFAGTLAGFITARRERDEALRARQAAEGATKFVLREMILIAAPTTPDFKNITHANVVRLAAKRAPARFAHDARTRFQVLMGLGRSLRDLGDYTEGLACFRGALAAAEEAYGPGTGECVRPLLYLVESFDSLGRHAEANEHRAQAIAASRALAPSDVDALDARGMAMVMSVAYGNARDAEEELRSLLGEYESAGHSDSDTYNDLRAELANTLTRKGRRDDGLKIRRSIIEDERNRKGPLHADTLRVTVPFVDTLHSAGYSEEALALAQRTLEEMLQIYDAGHERVQFCRQQIAEVLLSLGRSEESLAEIRECMKLVPPTRPDTELATVKFEFTMAMALCSNGLAEEALPYAERSYAVQKRFFGESHNVTLDAKFVQGNAIALVPGRTDEGLGIMRESIRERVAQNLVVITSRQYLARTLSMLGRIDEAIAEQMVVVKEATKALGSSNPFTLRMLRQLADYCEKAGRPEEAQNWRRQISE